MQSQNRLFDDFVKIMNGAAGTVAGMTREAQDGMKERMREWVGGMDFVSRDEFEAVKAMAAQAREEVEALRNRLAALEAGKGKPAGSAASAAAAKPATGRKAGPSTGVETPEE
ncbi:accessory factor UbiK family protein [Sphingomonas sp. KRR8]|uniref:accessory factor UbiK family protein n=1 Tax=Sphingomonas sp. KRR8 TaxID=2942996 RepID=UPI002020C757|nr:accessory factor UbiK family protein [Sphingomonas sp. KRR8]URD61750.1 accessory factor UbiK family protein [Sphingomonas sp. KRR8]